MRNELVSISDRPLAKLVAIPTRLGKRPVQVITRADFMAVMRTNVGLVLVTQCKSGNILSLGWNKSYNMTVLTPTFVCNIGVCNITECINWLDGFRGSAVSIRAFTTISRLLISCIPTILVSGLLQMQLCNTDVAKAPSLLTYMSTDLEWHKSKMRKHWRLFPMCLLHGTVYDLYILLIKRLRRSWRQVLKLVHCMWKLLLQPK